MACTTVGSHVNLASCLQSDADPGSILLSRDTLAR